MSSAPIKAGSAFVELTIRNKLNAGLKSASGQLKSFASGVQSIGAGLTGIGASVSGMGAAILGPLAGAAKHFANTGDALDEMSSRTGVAVDHLSELVYAAEMGGASAADLEIALKTMAKNGMDPSQFDAVAASIAAIEDPTERVAAALKVWGKSGTKLLPVIESLQSLRGEARGLGLTISPESAKRAAALSDAMDRLLKVGKDFIFEVGNAIAEPLTRFIDLAARLGATIANWISENQQLVVSVAAVGVVAVTAGAAITAIGVSILVAAAAIGGIVAGITALITPVGAAVAAIALLVGGIAAAATGWLLFTESGRYASESFIEMIGGMANAIAQGNILNAWGQLGTGMMIVWLEVVKKIKQAFFQVINEVVTVMAITMKTLASQIRQLPFGEKLADDISGIAGLGQAVTRMVTDFSLGSTSSTISSLQAQLDGLRGMASGGMNSALPQLPKLAAILDGLTGKEGGAGSILGGAQGTFNSAAAGLLGRSGGPMDRTAKAAEKQNGILEKMRELLEGIDDGIEDLEGFSFQ